MTTTPQQGTAAFSVPSGLTVKKTLPIADVVNDPQPAAVKQSAAAPQSKPETESQIKENQGIISDDNKKAVESDTTVAVKESPRPEAEVKPVKSAAKELEELENEKDSDDLYQGDEFGGNDENTEDIGQGEQLDALAVKAAAEPEDAFTQQWNKMLETVFANVRTILYPLKNHPPTIKDKILSVKVKGAILEEHFNAHKREVLAYWRNNVDEKIEDVEVITDETLEEPKMIFDNNDKMAHFKEENKEFSDFLNILNLKIKD